MKNFSKIFCAVLLCLFGVMGVQAKTEKVYATFENPSNTNTTWTPDASGETAGTFTWSTTYYNQLRNIGLPTGDITKYKKLVVNTEIKSGDQFRILIYKGGSNLTLYASNGVNEFILADTLKALYPDTYNEFLLACDEVCLSGNNAAAPGEAVIKEVYMETYNDEGEKVYATFESPNNTNTTWTPDASGQTAGTFTWSTTYYNQLRNIGLPSGDISKYKKLVVDTEIKSGNQFRILIYKGGSNLTLYAQNGVNEFILADTLKALYPDTYNEFLLACDEICLSGNNAAAPGEAVINEVYLETYPENEVVDIPDIVYEEDPGKPAGDFVDFTEAFPSLQPRIGLGTDGHPIVLGNGDVVVGQRTKNVIADLSGFSKLTMVTSPNLKLVLYMNHEIDAKQNAGDYTDDEAGKYLFQDLQANENGLIEFDLTTLDKQDLNCICLPWDNNNKGTVWYILLTEKDGKTVYLKPAIWDVEDATERYAVYMFNNNEAKAWADFAAVEGAEGIYTATVPARYTGIVLARLNGETTENNWENVWNQTADIKPVNDKALYTITGWGEGENAKSTYEESVYGADQPVEINSMAIVGDFIGGVATEEDAEPWWNPANGWAMVQDAENAAVWTLTKRFVAEEKKYEYKAVANGNWNDYVLPAGDNANFVFGTKDYPAGKYILTFTANTEDHTLTLDAQRVVPVTFPENAIVFDFEAAAAAGENPANKNGSAANGQAFYGWENEGKTDSKRQDYKGYEWAEGSVLPEVCQVWRRSDRINGNMIEGGLKCPSNKEMAIDGLNAGDKVIIVYDALDASDKELIWAIGDGSSDETLNGPRTTATINGVEAVSGTTTIASGAEIVVNSVTPAENGTGYIVFQVKKGMIINQIAVIPAPAPVSAPYYLSGNFNDWGVDDLYKLELNTKADEGIEEYMITVQLAADAQFKVVKAEDPKGAAEDWVWYPAGTGNAYGENGELAAAGTYIVYFRPNRDGGDDWFHGYIYVFNPTADGINTIAAEAQKGNVYNMQGIRVAQPTKGLYIINGKKVVVK